jgi:hypothetical protein
LSILRNEKMRRVYSPFPETHISQLLDEIVRETGGKSPYKNKKRTLDALRRIKAMVVDRFNAVKRMPAKKKTRRSRNSPADARRARDFEALKNGTYIPVGLRRQLGITGDSSD